MESEVKILEALFGPSIPTEKAAILPEIMGHIRAIDDLLQGKSHQRARPRISDPAISGPINRRIVELYAEHGKDWPKIAAAICQEFQVRISPDACRGRHKDAVARQEAYAALSGSAIQAGHYTTPLAVMQHLDARREDKSAEPIIEAIKAEAIKLYQEGGDVKCIAEHLGVRPQWMRGILPPVGAPEPNSPGSPDSSPPKKEASPLSEAEIDAELIRLQDSGMSPKEIRAAMLYQGVDFGLVELRDRLAAMARKALQDRKAAKAASEPEIPANCNRAELDAVMWRLWDHGKGKAPDEISDLLCSKGYSYGTTMVERRLRQQGAEL